MGSLHIITGGGRSGKSRFALQWAARFGSAKCFIATCPRIDDEMDSRIKAHQDERADLGWDTVEAQEEIVSVLHPGYDVFLLDCVTLWINNLMYKYEKLGETLTESIVSGHCNALIQKVSAIPAHLVVVTNEVGMGIIPEEPSTRLYRDLVGRANQTIASAAGTAVLMSCGIPMVLKGELQHPNLSNPDGDVLC